MNITGNVTYRLQKLQKDSFMASYIILLIWSGKGKF